MAIHGSGSPIDMGEIVAEFGGSAPHSINEYYKDGSYVPSTISNTVTGTASSLSQTTNSIGSSPQDGVWWRYYYGFGYKSRINQTTEFYGHAWWTDQAYTSGTGILDVTMTLDQKGTYTVNEYGYRPSPTTPHNTSIYVNGALSASITSGQSHTFTVTSACTLRLYCTMGTVGNYHEHQIRVYGNAGNRDLTTNETVNTSIPTGGVISFDDFYGGKKTL